jgi:hypothetical protein
MTAPSGVLWAAVLLLMLAGWAKLRQPNPLRMSVRILRSRDSSRLTARLSQPLGSVAGVRTAGLAELIIGAYALLLGGRVASAVVAATYLALAGMAAVLATSAPGTDCGCFGAAASPAGPTHVVVDALAALIAGIAVLWPASGLLSAVSAHPATAGATLAAAAVLTGLGYLALTAVPALLAAVAATPPAAVRS